MQPLDACVSWHMLHTAMETAVASSPGSGWDALLWQSAHVRLRTSTCASCGMRTSPLSAGMLSSG